MNTYEVEIGGNYDRVTVRAKNCMDAERKVLARGKRLKIGRSNNYVSKIEIITRDQDIDVP